MANKYTALPIPPRRDLEVMYYDKNMTQCEIGIKYGTTQKVVFGWFKKLGIKSRVAAKRNQNGCKNDAWKGNDATYSAFHYRVVALKGKPKRCEVCKTTDVNKNYDWACVGEYNNVNDYKRMCRSCHWKHDRIGDNFPNHKKPRPNSSANVRKSAK